MDRVASVLARPSIPEAPGGELRSSPRPCPRRPRPFAGLPGRPYRILCANPEQVAPQIALPGPRSSPKKFALRIDPCRRQKRHTITTDATPTPCVRSVGRRTFSFKPLAAASTGAMTIPCIGKGHDEGIGRGMRRRGGAKPTGRAPVGAAWPPTFAAYRMRGLNGVHRPPHPPPSGFRRDPVRTQQPVAVRSRCVPSHRFRAAFGRWKAAFRAEVPIVRIRHHRAPSHPSAAAGLLRAMPPPVPASMTVRECAYSLLSS